MEWPHITRTHTSNKKKTGLLQEDVSQHAVNRASDRSLMMLPRLPTILARAPSSSRRREMAPLISLAWDVLISCLCNSALPLTSFVFTGVWLGAGEVSGLGLGISVCNITGVCIFSGMATAMDTLCSQAYGAKRYRAVGTTFMRGTLLTAVLTFPLVGALWYYMRDALVAMGQDPNIAMGAGAFSRGYLWGMAAYAVFENLKRCLQAQNETTHAKYVSIAGILANVLFHYVTMGVFGMGIYGAGVALSLTGIFMLTSLVVVTWRCELGVRQCWSDIFSWDVLQQWPQYLKDCAPGLMGVFLEWASIEASIFIAGLVGNVELATQVTLLSAYGIMFNAGLSISVASHTRVGNLLGEGDAVGAQQAARAAQKLAVCSAMVVSLCLWLGDGLWPKVYGVTPEVMERIRSVAPLYAFVVTLDQVQNSFTGILKGMHMQHIQAMASVYAFWIMGVGLGTYLAYGLGWGVPGLWLALAVGECPLVAFYIIRIKKVDWKERIAAARARNVSDTDTEVDSDAGDIENDNSPPASPLSLHANDCDSDYDFGVVTTGGQNQESASGVTPGGSAGAGTDMGPCDGENAAGNPSAAPNAPELPQAAEAPEEQAMSTVGNPSLVSAPVADPSARESEGLLPSLPAVGGDSYESTTAGVQRAVTTLMDVVPYCVPVVVHRASKWRRGEQSGGYDAANERSRLLPI